MSGTPVRIVETVSALADAKIHQKAVDDVVTHELRYGLYVDSATTMVAPALSSDELKVLRITTIVLSPKH